MEENHDSISVESESTTESSLIVGEEITSRASQVEQQNLNMDSFEFIANAIDEAFLYKKNMMIYTLPTPQQWIGPRLFYVWILPILFVKKIRNFLYSFYLYLCE